MSPRIAVLGAGIMGACAALFLARRGAQVVLIDAEDAPLKGASRWNEGKIHLGFLYAADVSLNTARSVLDGGVSFAPLLRELVGHDLGDITEADDLYLVHRDSIVPSHTAAEYYRKVAELVRHHPQAANYLVDASHAAVRELSAEELREVANPDYVVTGYVCPERSLSTARVGDLMVAALDAETRIEMRMRTRVARVVPEETESGRWRIFTQCESTNSESFDYVVNALWHGRIAIDATAGIYSPPGWSHRYRVSAFVRTRHPVSAPSAVLVTGAFGDVKNYNARDFYISWYPAGLIAESEALAPPPVDRLALEPAELAHAIEAGLSPALPWVRELFAAAEQVRIEGGYVFAMGKGSLDDPCATVHRRDRFGISRRGNYVSVDTGKYSSAPLLAWRIANELLGP